MDEQAALAAGYSPEEIAGEKARRAKAYAVASVAKQDAALRAGGGLAGDENFFDNLHTGIGKAMSDMYLGGRQLINAITPGDNPALAAEAADRNKRDAALMKTGGGLVGKVGTDIASSFLPLSLASKVVKGAGMLPSLARAAGSGAATELLTPEENYSPVSQAVKGAAFGAGGEGVGRAVGLAVNPFGRVINKAGPTAKENAEVLNRAGLPAEIPATQTDSSVVQAMTNALEQIPVLGAGVRKARDANAAWLTRQATEGTGQAVSELPPSVRDAMFDRLNKEGNAFRTQQAIPMTSVSADAKAAADEVKKYAQATSQASGTKPLESAAKTLGDVQVPSVQLPPGIPAPPPGIGMPGPSLRSVPQTRTADEVMDLRNAASELAHKETDPVLKQQYRAYRESLADELRNVHGSDRFNNWLKQWGQMEDVVNAAGGKSGKELVGGHLTPERLAMNLDDSFRPGTKLDKVVSAATENMPTPPRGWNRAMLTSVLLGAPILGGAGADALRGDFGPGTGAGIGVSSALVRGLSRKAPSQAEIDAIVKALTATGIGTGKQF